MSGDISIKGLRKSFGGTDALRDVDLDVRNGEVCVVLGPSGCGKSTLLRLVAGLETPTAGSIAIAGRDVAGLEPVVRGCAMVFQNYALYPHMTVAENIAYALRVAGAPRQERRRRAEETAALVRLDGLLDRKPATLSGGQRQRVAMARAIIRSPQVFLFDEPLSNLDAELRVEMRHEVRRIHDAVGATSIFVTHDQTEAMTLADRLVVMRGGAVRQVGTPAEVYDRPRTLDVARFVGSPSMGTLRARVDAAAGTLRLADGQALGPGHGIAGLRDGREVEIGIRPEALIFAQVDAGLSARVTFTEEMGAARLHHVELAGRVVPMMTADRRPAVPGTTIRVAVAADAVHIFDPETGHRL